MQWDTAATTLHGSLNQYRPLFFLVASIGRSGPRRRTAIFGKAEVSLEGVRAVLSRKYLNDPSKYLDLQFYEMARAVG
jgi:hypothetical protein